MVAPFSLQIKDTMFKNWFSFSSDVANDVLLYHHVL
jgi:hypothetical protein